MNKEPSFTDRAAASAKARQALLEKAKANVKVFTPEEVSGAPESRVHS